MLSKGSTKTRMVSMPVSIAGLSESGGNAKSQENPASTLLLSSGNAGSCCKGWYPCFCDGLSYFLRICRIRLASPAPGTQERKSRSLYTGILDSFLSKLHSGRNYRDIHDGGEIESFHGKRPHFSLHTFILHKPLLFTTSPQKIFYSASPSFRSERSGEIILQNGASSWLLKLLNCKWIMVAAPFYRRGAFLYKTNAYNLWFQL